MTRAPDEELIERLAKEIERATVADYEWTEEQFEIWWNKDPAFVERVCGRPGAPMPMTKKEYVLWQLREGLKASGLALS